MGNRLERISITDRRIGKYLDRAGSDISIPKSNLLESDGKIRRINPEKDIVRVPDHTTHYAEIPDDDCVHIFFYKKIR